MLSKLRRFLYDKKGQGMAEYIIIVALIIVVAIVAFRLFGARMRQTAVSSSDRIKRQTEAAAKQSDIDAAKYATEIQVKWTLS